MDTLQERVGLSHDSRRVPMKTNYSNIILNRILFLCEKRGITINKLADMSGIRQSTINNLVCGASVNPKIRTLHKIAIAFNMTLAEFLDYTELNEYSFDDETEE
jgi:transcriptional regulator with XRE-family HTH domain